MKYIVKENEGIVVAIIDDCKEDFLRFFVRNFPQEYQQSARLFATVGNKAFLRHKYVGVAKCAKEDIFDVEKGKKLAAKRAILKYEVDRQKKMDYLFRTWYNCFENLEEMQTYRTDSAVMNLQNSLYEN